eukprot:TRINITY_DN5244_c0_g2_i1.p1 TRINITY_DN5244_c0_g2~~TRINITY_DN5244_c0_g2_i1.p1  ORF type:complete len:292 (+),score=48.78 TRINITY_DN5244_c0_g2_i1:60-935(+)
MGGGTKTLSPMRFSRARLFEAFQRRPRVLLLAVMFVLVVMTVKRWDFCWGAKPKMTLLYDKTVTAMEEVGVNDWWLDYGTLLGAVRDKGLLEHEYDLDIGITYEECSKMTSPEGKAVFAKYGLKLYHNKDYIPEKRTLTYDTIEKRIKMSDPFLGVGCARAYGPNGYYVDFYPYISLTPSELTTRRDSGNFTLFPEFSMDGSPYLLPPSASNSLEDPSTLACTPLGLVKEEQYKGGCFLHNAIRPLKPLTFMGKNVRIPNAPEIVLREAYGRTWGTPITKGIRGPLCYWHM